MGIRSLEGRWRNRGLSDPFSDNRQLTLATLLRNRRSSGVAEREYGVWRVGGGIEALSDRFSDNHQLTLATLLRNRRSSGVAEWEYGVWRVGGGIEGSRILFLTTAN